MKKTYLSYINLIFLILLNIAFSNDKKFYNPIKIDKNIVVDGKLNEDVWRKAQIINDFQQVFPSFLL